MEFHYTAQRSDLAKVGPGARALIADTMARPACAFAFEDRLAPSRIPRGKGCGSCGRRCHGPEVSHNRLRIRLVDIGERDHPGSRNSFAHQRDELGIGVCPAEFSMPNVGVGDVVAVRSMTSDAVDGVLCLAGFNFGFRVLMLRE